MKDTITSVPLKHGDICVMEGYFQKNYIHEISKTSGKARFSAASFARVEFSLAAQLHNAREG